MAFVLDASVSVAWHFGDQRTEVANDLARRAAFEGVIVPAHWQIETANALLQGERLDRTDAEAIQIFADRLAIVPLEVDNLPGGAAFDRLMPLARALGLRMYDAAYLELAERRNAPLATFDLRLARAAAARGVEILGAPA